MARVVSAGEGEAVALPPLEQSRGVVTLRSPLEESRLLMPLIQQFQVLQQQMFDQFHESLMAMAQVFTTLHREQFSALRDELDQLKRLTEEIQELRAELRKHAPEPALSGTTVLATAPAGDRTLETQMPATTPPTDAPPLDQKTAPVPEISNDVHLWLAQRIATLQQDRHNRWNRLLQALKGG